MPFNLSNLFKRKKKQLQPQEDNYRFRWLDPGKDSPFNKRVLDIRSFTWGIISTSEDTNIVNKYSDLRYTLGEEYIGKSIEDAEVHETFFEFPHNGSKVEGILYKSESMDVKWDMYSYDKIIYFTRSWTGELIYKAYLDILENNNVGIYQIEYPKSIGFEIANSAVYFLLKSHVQEVIHPHRVPSDLNTEIEIAHYSLEQYGNKACYASYNDITDAIAISNDHV